LVKEIEIFGAQVVSAQNLISRAVMKKQGIFKKSLEKRLKLFLSL